MFCENCGNEIQEDWVVCPNCGKELEKKEDNVIQPMYNKQKKIYSILKVIIVLVLVFMCRNLLTYNLSGVLNSGRPSTSVGEEEDSEQSSVGILENDSDTSGTMSFQEYLQKCIEVENVELARNPEKYEGKDIILEGEFSVIGGKIVIGWFEDTGIIQVNYDNKAIDENGNEVGNIISGDSGIVVGKYSNGDTLESKHIDAVAVILRTE